MIEERNAIFSKTHTECYGEWDFTDADTQEHLHSIHPYPARMIPQIADKAICNWSKPGDTVLDPFAGCGTVLLESVLSGRNAIGVDTNPVSKIICEAKTAKYTETDLKTLKEFLNNFDDLYRTAAPNIPNYPKNSYWFDEKAIIELGKIKTCIEQLKDNSYKMAICIFSAIIVRISYQDSDTRYSRKQYEYTSGQAKELYKNKLEKAIIAIEETKSYNKSDAKIYIADGRNLDMISDESINLIITSPPYLNAYDYHKYHRHRIEWIDGDASFARKNEIGKHDEFTKKGAQPEPYFDDMTLCFKEWYRVMKKDSYALIVIGDSIVNKKPVEVADRFIKIATEIGFENTKNWIRNLNINKKSFNQQARIKQEHVILLHKV